MLSFRSVELAYTLLYHTAFVYRLNKLHVAFDDLLLFLFAQRLFNRLVHPLQIFLLERAIVVFHFLVQPRLPDFIFCLLVEQLQNEVCQSFKRVGAQKIQRIRVPSE